MLIITTSIQINAFRIQMNRIGGMLKGFGNQFILTISGKMDTCGAPLWFRLIWRATSFDFVSFEGWLLLISSHLKGDLFWNVSFKEIPTLVSTHSIWGELFLAEGFLNGDMNYFLLENRFRWYIENPYKFPIPKCKKNALR